MEPMLPVYTMLTAPSKFSAVAANTEKSLQAPSLDDDTEELDEIFSENFD